MPKILVCSDGSNYSLEACRYAAWLAKLSQASVTILYVSPVRKYEIPAIADLSGSLGIQPYEDLVSQMQAIEVHKARFIREHSLKPFADLDAESTLHFVHETGIVIDVIERYAKSADLVVIGKRGENADFAKLHLGSMLERVVRAVHCPCLVTARSYRPIKRIALAYDGGASCQKALQYLAHHSELNEIELHVLTVSETGKEDVAADRLAEAETSLKNADISASYQLLSGLVVNALSDYVQEAQIDLLVAGAYGHSRIRELLIGSTTTELLRNCRIPVLCFR